MKDLSNDIISNLFGEPKAIIIRQNENEERKGFQMGSAYIVGMTKKEYKAECIKRSSFSSNNFWV